MTTIIYYLVVVIKFPGRMTNFLLYVQTIYNNMFTNPRYSGSAAKVLTLKNALKTLTDTELACKTKPPTKTIAERDAAKVTVKSIVKSLGRDVQDLADDDPANAQTIIEESGMFWKKKTKRGKQQNSAENTNEPGTVKLIGQGKGAHEWRYSTDNKTWINLPATLVSKTKVSSLTSGVVYYFQNRQIKSKGVYSEWSQSVSIRVN